MMNTSLCGGFIYDNGNLGVSDPKLHIPENETNFLNDNANTTLLEPDQYYTTVYTVCSVILNIFIFLVGFVGNILIIVVIVQTTNMRTTTNCYLISLAVADCLVLLSATLPGIPETFFQVNHWPWGRAMCSILIFLQYLGVDTSSLSITAFTVERYIAICHPIRAHTMCTVKRAKKIIIGIWVFGILYCSPWIGLTKIDLFHRTSGVIEICTFRLKRNEYLAYYMIDLIVFYIIPLLLAAVLYICIARILYTATGSKQSRPRCTNGSMITDRRNTQRKSRIQVVRMLVVIVVVFGTTWLPYRMTVVYNSIAKERYMNNWFWLFCRTMIYINSAINPVLYNAMSVKFRRAFRRLLCCGFELTFTRNITMIGLVLIVLGFLSGLNLQYQKSNIHTNATFLSEAARGDNLLASRHVESRAVTKLTNSSSSPKNAIPAI